MAPLMFQKRRVWGFTLVELIVVVVVIAILATIGFAGFSNYTSSARDSRKLSNVQTIFRSLNTYRSAQLFVPLPDSPSIELKYDGNSLSTQWVVGSGVLSKIGMGDTVLDLTRIDGYYILLTNRNRNFVQLGVFLENEGIDIASWALSWIAPAAYASSRIDFSKYFPYVYGEKLGIVLSNEPSTKNMPIQETTWARVIDLWTGSTLYKVIIANADSASASGVYVGTGAQLMACDKPIESNYKCGTHSARDFFSSSDTCVERTLASFKNETSKCKPALACAGTWCVRTTCINTCQIPSTQLIYNLTFTVEDSSPSSILSQGEWKRLFRAVNHFSNGMGQMTAMLPYEYFSDINGSAVTSTASWFSVECTGSWYAFTGSLSDPQCVPKDCYAIFIDDYLLPDILHGQSGTGTKIEEIVHGTISTDRPASCSFWQYSVGTSAPSLVTCEAGYTYAGSGVCQ